MNKEKCKAYVNVHLLLEKEGQFLYYLRQNTGYADGFYNLIAGHVEDGETATQAMVREAYEEAGIHIREKDLRVVHTMHRKTNRENIDLFLRCRHWQGEIQNKEPEKCGGLSFYPILVPPSMVYTSS